MPNLLAEYDFTRMLQEHEQNLDGLLSKLDLDPVFAQLTRADIELELPEANQTNFRAGWIGHKPRFLEVYHIQSAGK
jgi:hypothetical protein